MNLPTIKLSADWEKFFRDKGQFIQPLDQIHDPEQLEVFKLWGQGIWDHFQDESQALVQKAEDAEEKMEDINDTFRDLKIEIINGINNSTPEEALTAIRKLCE